MKKVLTFHLNLFNMKKGDIPEDLKKDYTGTLLRKTCSSCNKTYPRTPDFFYRKEHKSSSNHYRYEPLCITCYTKQTKIWKKNNLERKKIIDSAYKITEHGFVMGLWNTVKSSKHGNEFENYQQFLNCWEKQKEIYGYKCPYTGIEMTTIRHKSNKGKRIMTYTNISTDRILSSQPYNERNIMFISWGVNAMKGNINTKVAKKFLEFVRERYNTDEVE
jgi:hypothetical protein